MPVKGKNATSSDAKSDDNLSESLGIGRGSDKTLPQRSDTAGTVKLPDNNPPEQALENIQARVSNISEASSLLSDQLKVTREDMMVVSFEKNLKLPPGGIEFLKESFSCAKRLSKYIQDNGNARILYLGKQNPFILGFLHNLLGHDIFNENVIVRPVTDVGHIADVKSMTEDILDEIIPTGQIKPNRLIVFRPLYFGHSMQRTFNPIKTYLESRGVDYEFDFSIASSAIDDQETVIDEYAQYLHKTNTRLYHQLLWEGEPLSYYIPVSRDSLALSVQTESSRATEGDESSWVINPHFRPFTIYLERHITPKINPSVSSPKKKTSHKKYRAPPPPTQNTY